MKMKFTGVVLTAIVLFSFIISDTVHTSDEEEIYISQLNFENAEIASVFSALADIGDRNIIIDSDVAGKVTITLKNLTWREAFLAVLSASDLTAYEEMGFIKVMTQAKFNTKLQQIREQEEALVRFKPKNHIVIPIHNATAQEIKNSIDPLIINEADRPTVDVRTNSLIFTASDSLINLVKPIIAKLDVEVRQVAIEVRMLRVDSSSLWELGVNWRASKEGGSVRQRTFKADQVELDKKLLLLDITESLRSGVSIDAKIQSMVEENKAEIVAVPHITTLDNTPATISSGKRIPIITFDEARNTIVNLEEALTSLTVTPHVLSEERIQLDIMAQRTSAEGTGLGTVFTTELAENTVVVSNGETAVIGGMRTRTQTKQFTGIPILQSIPLIGMFFRYTKSETREMDLIIFLTPNIVEI